MSLPSLRIQNIMSILAFAQVQRRHSVASNEEPELMSGIKPVLIVASGLTMIVAFIFYTVSNALPSW